MSAAHAYLSTALGDLLVVTQDQHLIGLYFPAHRYPPAAARIGRRVEPRSDPLLMQAHDELSAYLGGTLTAFTVPTRPQGDPWSQRVWDLLCTIPYGTTTTYGSIADELGNRHLAQRVGQAVGHNPISIIIPCHRVVGADGALTGYAGGLARKRQLLTLEVPIAADAGRLF